MLGIDVIRYLSRVVLGDCGMGLVQSPSTTLGALTLSLMIIVTISHLFNSLCGYIYIYIYYIYMYIYIYIHISTQCFPRTMSTFLRTTALHFTSIHLRTNQKRNILLFVLSCACSFHVNSTGGKSNNIYIYIYIYILAGYPTSLGTLPLSPSLPFFPP